MFSNQERRKQRKYGFHMRSSKILFVWLMLFAPFHVDQSAASSITQPGGGPTRLTFLNCAGPCIVGDQSNWKQTITSAMTVSKCTIDAAVYPTGANLVADVKKNPTPVSLGVWTGGTTIFSSTTLVLTAGGATSVTQSGIAAAGAMVAGDYLVSFVTAIGSTIPGQGVNIVCSAQ